MAAPASATSSSAAPPSASSSTPPAPCSPCAGRGEAKGVIPCGHGGDYMSRRPVQRETQHEIGIRDLKAKLSEVVDEVREHEATYVITHRGKAVGRLVPMERWTEEASPSGGRPGEGPGE